jgi:hypothetical protein
VKTVMSAVALWKKLGEELTLDKTLKTEELTD